MKTTVLALAALLFSTAAFAQNWDDGYEKMNNLKVNLFSPIFRTVSGFYERKVSERSSIQFGVAYTGWSSDNFNLRLRGLMLTPEYRMYLSEYGAMEGFYVAPFLRYSNLQVKNYDQTSSGTLRGFGGGLLVGYQFIFRDMVTLDAFVGPKVGTKAIVYDNENMPRDIKVPGILGGFGVRSGLTLGITF